MKKKPQKLSMIIAAVALAAVFAYTLSRSDMNENDGVTIERSEVAPEVEAPTAWTPDVPKTASATEVHSSHSHGKSTTPVSKPDESSQTRLVEALPTVESYRAEAEANPHVTPESVVRFSYLLTLKSEALKSESEAYAFFNELEDCMSSKDAPTSALVLCMRHAQTVSAKYKALGGKYERLESAAPRSVRDALSVF